jgi:hypothetical protein
MKSYKLVPVDVKPEKDGEYGVILHTGKMLVLNFGEDGHWRDDTYIGLYDNSVTHYLLPVSEEEHREEMREVWEAGEKFNAEGGWKPVEGDETPDFDTFYQNKYKPE